MSAINSNKNSMTVLVTGGTGFVMSNVVKHLLQTHVKATAIILDLAPFEGLVVDFFSPVQERVFHFQGDIRDREFLDQISADWSITHVVHAAMIAHVPQWEQESPAKFIDVNVMGTVNVLEWARQLEGLQRFLYVSSGDVYGEPQPGTSESPHHETGTLDQPELYAISKYASEQIVRRYGELFEMDTCRVRFSGVFGPMERPTPGRAIMAMPYHMVRSVIEQRPLRLTAETLEAGADFISAEDIGYALPALLRADALRYNVYNVAYGHFTTVPEVLDAFKTAVPHFEHEVVTPDQADIIRDPTRRLARWNAYDIERISSELGWTPRPIAEQMASYFDWVMEDPEKRCPPLPTREMLLI